ncbi:hypothetical protein SJI18_24455, partial [Clostridium frigoriphilum]
YENKDDEYSNKAGKLYFKYTNTWEITVESVKDFGITGIDLGKGLVNLAGDVLKGGYGLVKGAVVIAGAGVAMKSMMETGDALDCLKTCITETKGYGNTVSSVLKDPVILAEGMAQSASDTVEEKGIAYSTLYVVGGLLLTKGLGKVSSVSKVGETVDVEKNVLKVDKGVDTAKFIYKNNPMNNPKAVKDIIKNSDAVYRYSPNPKSESIGGYADACDWADPKQVAQVIKRRKSYHDKNDNIVESVNKMRNEGYSTENIAREANKQRNMNRLNDYIDDKEGLKRVMGRNVTKYDNPNGPSAEF